MQLEDSSKFVQYEVGAELGIVGACISLVGSR